MGNDASNKESWQWQGTRLSSPPPDFDIKTASVNKDKLATLTIYQGFNSGNNNKTVWTLVPDNLTWENEITHETQNALDTFKNTKTGLLNKVKEASNFVAGQQFMLKHQNAELWKSSSVKKDFTVKFIFWWGMCGKYSAKDEVWLPIMKLVDNFDLMPISENKNGYAPPIMPVAEFMKNMVTSATKDEKLKFDDSSVAGSTDTIKKSQSDARDEQIKEIEKSITGVGDDWSKKYNSNKNTASISGYNVYYDNNKYKIADGTIAVNKSFSSANELAKYIYDEQAKTDKENGTTNEVKISSGTLSSLTDAVSAVYGKVDQLIAKTMEKSQFVKLQIGKSTLIDAIVKKCTWSFDYTEVEDGYPYAGSVQLSLHQCHVPVLKEIEEEYSKV